MSASFTQLVAKLADRVLAPQHAVRNAAAAAFELSQHTESWRDGQWRDGLTAPVVVDEQRRVDEVAQGHLSQG